MRLRPFGWGILATCVLLIVYGTVVSLVSGAEFALDQFRQFWYFVVSLAVGFGIQIGLYTYLKEAMREHTPAFSHPSQEGNSKVPSRGGAGGGNPKSVVRVTGTTSTVAMISCCAHYLANIVPILGIAGALSIVGQYQKELFWVGLVFNMGGIAYIAKKVYQFRKHL